MIRRIYASEIDRTNLSKLKTVTADKSIKIEYRNVVVQKPWGYEYLLFENNFVSVWILHLKRGHENSLHCHPRKKTSMIVLSGKIRATTLTDWFDLNHLDGLVYDAGLFHTQKALADDTFLLEIETPPDKADLVRLKDAYGRAGKKYEGVRHLIKASEKFKHNFFDKKTLKKEKKHIIHKSIISLQYSKSSDLKMDLNGSDSKKIYCILEDKLIDRTHLDIIGVGSIFHPVHLSKIDSVKLIRKSLILTIQEK